MYQTKPRSDVFEQPSFLRPKKQVNTTFWDDDDIRPFRLSMPEHFRPPAPNVFPQKQSNERNQNGEHNQSYKRNQSYERNQSHERNQNNAPKAYREDLPANRQPQRQHAHKPRTFANRQSESYIYNRPHSTLVSYFIQKIYTNWIAKELYFSMSKLSFLVLIIGLFFLSSLLFITGFLVAVNIYDIGAPKLPPITNMNIPYSSLNMPIIETPRLPTPPIMVMPITPQITPSIVMAPAAPNPNIMKMGAQGGLMADVPIVDTAHMPSVYAQLPAQALPPTPQPMPQSGGHYIQPQQAPTVQHMPSQGYAQQQSPYPPQQQAPIRTPIQQPYSQQTYPQQVNQPAPQHYPPNPASYYQPQQGTR